MVTDKLINKAFHAAEPLISADRSRCVRMRFNKSTCSICTANCKTGAISIDGAIDVNTEKCTECMLCVSECTMGCFTNAAEDFFVLLSKLRKVQNSVRHPVLGCNDARNAEAHVKTGCLGLLSEEYLIALTEYLDKPLYLNLADCGACRNSFIVTRLKERIQSARMKTSLGVGKKILLAEKKADLIFEEVPLDRRGFFQALKTMGFTQVAGLIENNDAELPVSYTEKKLPLKRNVFNAVVKMLVHGNGVNDLLRNYAFTVKTGASCNNCFACIGMCPTGALKMKKDADGTDLLFNSSLCTGCGLCSDFCPAHGVSVSPGFFGANYFEYDICNADVGAAYAVACEN